MFEKAETFYVEGIRVRVSRRTVGVVDIEFVDDPPGFPGDTATQAQNVLDFPAHLACL